MIIFAAGTGYLPFLDMVDYLYKSNVIKSVNPNSELAKKYSKLDGLEIQFNLSFDNVKEFINYY